jgi:hypothetical protein
MPIEIRELHIRVAVSAPAGAGGSGSAAPPVAGAAGPGAPPTEALVAECVEQVLRILQQKSER